MCPLSVIEKRLWFHQLLTPFAPPNILVALNIFDKSMPVLKGILLSYLVSYRCYLWNHYLFIHYGYLHLYSTSSSLLLLRGVPDTAWILCRSFMPKRHRQLLVKDLPKVLRDSQSGLRTHDPSDERRRIYQWATVPHCWYFLLNESGVWIIMFGVSWLPNWPACCLSMSGWSGCGSWLAVGRRNCLPQCVDHVQRKYSAGCTKHQRSYSTWRKGWQSLNEIVDVDIRLPISATYGCTLSSLDSHEMGVFRGFPGSNLTEMNPLMLL